MSSDPKIPETLAQALASALESGASERVKLQAQGSSAWVDLKEVGPIGVRVLGLELEVEDPAPPSSQARSLATPFPGLPGALSPVEVDDRLGGGLLRSPLRRGRFIELELRGGRASLRPIALRERERSATHLDMSREGLGELLDELAQAMEQAD